MTRRETEYDYAERLLRVLEYIQGHLDEDLSPAALAKRAHFSVYHFHRIFKGFVGESVMAHIRRLRLERAAARLRFGDRPVTDIAHASGYDSHEAFTRAFGSRFGMSPSEYRSSVKPAPQLEAALRVETFPPRHLAYTRHRGTYQTVGEAWARLMAWAAPKGLLGPHAAAVGISWDDPDLTPDEHIRYDACIVIGAAIDPSGDIGVRVLPGGRWATTTHRGPYNRLGDTYVPLMSQWLPNRRLEPQDHPPIEIYHNRPGDTRPEDLVTDIQILLQESL
ncbi:MAG: AraC family transcriptional regulator [Myxococcales bacterium FL481]|nr:MAG: AraC family transcriptional regulator [Myxococcales bacterium FL481]